MQLHHRAKVLLFLFRLSFTFPDKSEVERYQKQCEMNETSNEQKLMCHRSSHKWNIHFNHGEIPTCSCGYKESA